MRDLQAHVKGLIEGASGGVGLAAFMLPDSDDLQSIPQDPANPLTAEKIALGKMLFHDTALATNGVSGETQSWSCSTCHHSAAGFKSGIPQGIGEGGIGFGVDGSLRVLDSMFDGDAGQGASNQPDLQPVASPTVLNSAYQDVMLWNGQFGNGATGSVNSGIAESLLMTPGTPKAENSRQLEGLETQAIAGIGVHRLQVEPGSVIQTMPGYRELWRAAYADQSTDVLMDAGKAIAAYERSLLANRSPFQLWLRGDNNALSRVELQGAELFFGKAGCVACHQGPALGSAPLATENEMFFAIGFADFDTSDVRIHGSVDEATSKGRGGFTRNPDDNYRFKIPQLYNLADTAVFGHGGSFNSIREVVEYKNAGMAQSATAESALDSRFRPLALLAAEIDKLTAFLSTALRDPDLVRYEPEAVPSGACVTVDAFDLMPGARCLGASGGGQG